eukprot:SAG31_NODE_2555_length_5496_cov_13.099314_4_plen_141_part_00
MLTPWVTRRLTRTARHLGSIPSRTFVAGSDGDGGSGGNPSDAMVHTERDGIEYFNPRGSTAALSATPFSRVVRAAGLVYGAFFCCCFLQSIRDPDGLMADLPDLPAQSPVPALAAVPTASHVSARPPRRRAGRSKISSGF